MIKRTQRFSGFLRKYMALFVLADIVLALLAGLAYPEMATGLRPIIPYGMFILLFPMMMGLVMRELKLVAKDKKIILVSIFLNFILSPILAFLWAQAFFAGLDPQFIAGWILKLTVPCSTMLVAWTGIAGGKVETALVIQVVSFFIAIAAIPLWMVALVGTYVPVDTWFIIQTVLWIIAVPMVIGSIARVLIIKKIGMKRFGEEIKPFLPPLSTLGMYLVLFIAISSEAHNILMNLNLLWVLIASVVIVYPALFLLSVWLSKKASLSYENGIALAFSTTAKNHGITLVLAISSFGGLSILAPSVVPMVQILLMLLILRMSPKIKDYLGSHHQSHIQFK